MNIQTVRTVPRSPWQNAYVERVIGSIRRECLDQERLSAGEVKGHLNCVFTRSTASGVELITAMI